MWLMHKSQAPWWLHLFQQDRNVFELRVPMGRHFGLRVPMGRWNRGRGRLGLHWLLPDISQAQAAPCTSSPFPGHIRAADLSLREQTLPTCYFSLVTGGISGVFLSGLPQFIFFSLKKSWFQQLFLGNPLPSVSTNCLFHYCSSGSHLVYTWTVQVSRSRFSPAVNLQARS